MLHHPHEKNYSRLYPITYELPIHQPLITISIPDIKFPHVNQASNPLCGCLHHNSWITVATVVKLLNVKA